MFKYSGKSSFCLLLLCGLLQIQHFHLNLPVAEADLNDVAHLDFDGSLGRFSVDRLHVRLSQASLATVRRLMSRETFSHLSSRTVSPP